MNAQADARRIGQCGYVDITHGCRHESLEYRMPEISTGHPITKALTEEYPMNRNQRRMAEYNARKAAEHIESRNYTKRLDSAFTRLSDGCSKRVAIAVSAAETKSKPTYQQQLERSAEALERSKKRIAYKDANPLGNKIHAVQKQRGKSIPAYFD